MEIINIPNTLLENLKIWLIEVQQSHTYVQISDVSVDTASNLSVVEWVYKQDSNRIIQESNEFKKNRHICADLHCDTMQEQDTQCE